jgi:hypothetical protein
MLVQSSKVQDMIPREAGRNKNGKRSKVDEVVEMADEYLNHRLQVYY